MTKLIVSKFGGTSLGNAPAIRQAAAIVLAQPERKLIVLSASAGTTNLLEECCETRDETVLRAVKQQHLDIARDLGIDNAVLVSVEQILRLASEATRLKPSPMRRDLILSFGERLSTLLFTEYLRTQTAKRVNLFDVTTVMVTDSSFGHATPEIDAIKLACDEQLLPSITDNDVTVTQGFIGAAQTQRPTTLGRGGSDYSAALLAEAIDASVLEIWTDVPGIATSDPRAVPNAQSIGSITYDEASELAHTGAKVLHPITIGPAARKSIPVFVGSTFQPDCAGTWIVPNTGNAPPVRAISFKDERTVITLRSKSMHHGRGFLEYVTGLFAEEGISIEHVTTSETSTSLTIADNNIPSASMFAKLKLNNVVKIEHGLSQISVIGSGIAQAPHLISELMAELAQFPIRMILLGASNYNITFLMSREDSRHAARRVHARFLEEPQTASTSAVAS